MPKGIYKRIPIEERFWSQVDKNGPIPTHCPELGPCWAWTGSTTKKGYGISYFGKNNSSRVHRYSYQLHYGNFDKELQICHKCDNTSCVNPEHLFIGTNQDNANDRVNKGRYAKGESVYNAILTEKDAEYIRNYSNRYGSGRELAKIFNCRESIISSIRNNRSYKNY